MNATHKIEKNLEVAPIETDFEVYGEMEEYEELDEEFFGSHYLDRRVDQGTGRGFRPDLELGEYFGEERPLKEQLRQFMQGAVTDNPNLSAEEKREYQLKLEKWIYALDLNLGDTEAIEAEFQFLEQDVASSGAYPNSVRKMAKAAGIDASEMQGLFKKYGLNGDSLPSPPDARVAALLNDEAFADKFSPLRQGVAEASASLKKELAKQGQVATDLNDAARAGNKERSSDDSAYRFLYDAHFHQDDSSMAFINARQQLAAETGRLLSALYGKEITADESPENAGCIRFDGISLNLAPNSGKAEIQFSKRTAIDWPKVTLVAYELDNFGGGRTCLPEWMKQAHYPVNVFDDAMISQKKDWWHWVLGPFSWMTLTALTIDKAVKNSDSDQGIPVGGELINIGVQSSGTIASESKIQNSETEAQAPETSK